MGMIIGVLNAIWAKSDPRIYVHSIGNGSFLLRVTNVKSRESLLSRSCWSIAGLHMFVSPWSPDFTPDEAPLASVVVPVEMRNVPYLLFNNESLSTLASPVGKPVSLAPETQIKENFKVAKLFVKVDLTKRLPDKIVSGFSNGREVLIDVRYPWLPLKCDNCGKYGHKKEDCEVGVPAGPAGRSGGSSPQKKIPEPSRKRSKSRPGRSREVKSQFAPSHVETENVFSNDEKSVLPTEGGEVVANEDPKGIQVEVEVLVKDSVDAGNVVVVGSQAVARAEPESVEVPSDNQTVSLVDAKQGKVVDVDGLVESQPEIVVQNACEGHSFGFPASSVGPEDLSEDLNVVGAQQADGGTPMENGDLGASDSGQPVSDNGKAVDSDTTKGEDKPFFQVNNRKCGRRVTKA